MLIIIGSTEKIVKKEILLYTHTCMYTNSFRSEFFPTSEEQIILELNCSTA